MLRQATIIVAFALLAPGCAEGPTADKDSARSGWRSTEAALGQAGISTGWSGSGTVSASGTSGAVYGNTGCTDGGSMYVEAAGEVTDERVVGAVSIEFDKCNVDGVIIDGVLDYSAEVTEDKVTGAIVGDLEYSGDAEGHCTIELAATVSSSGTSVGAASVGGSMCGYDWQDVFAD